MALREKIHGALVFGRRVRVLSEHLAALLPDGASVLDVGCGDGLIDHLIGDRRPDVQIRGIDVLVRPRTHIPVTAFDGHVIPHGDRSFDVVQFVDVLHHTDDPAALLGEARRVARRAIVIKDHLVEGLWAAPTLRVMDWAGNAHHGVALPYNYWTRRRWEQAFGELGLTVERWREALGLYPRPASWLFDRSLHFAARLGLGAR